MEAAPGPVRGRLGLLVGKGSGRMEKTGNSSWWGWPALPCRAWGELGDPFSGRRLEASGGWAAGLRVALSLLFLVSGDPGVRVMPLSGAESWPAEACPFATCPTLSPAAWLQSPDEVSITLVHVTWA